MRIRDWYFQGWERRETVGGKTELVYTGEVYTFSGGIRPAQKRSLLYAAPLLVLYVLIALLPAAGGMWRIAAIPQLLELIPLLYLVMGLVRLWLAKEPLTFRDWYASWRRLGVAAAASAVFTAGMALAEIVFILLYAGGAAGAEIPYLLAEIACLALSLALAVYVKKHPCTPSVATEKE